ncbi:hypothetical protein NMY22_g18213 [Coprinellus aureogranulatus]|nr:hypothetical protein NMY22_g18213 [Coprinellus aureogranulatus]
MLSFLRVLQPSSQLYCALQCNSGRRLLSIGLDEGASSAGFHGTSYQTGANFRAAPPAVSPLSPLSHRRRRRYVFMFSSLRQKLKKVGATSDQGAQPEIGGRNPVLPTIEQVSSHPLVKAPHGPIFILKGRQEKEWMESLLGHVAAKKCPKNRKDAEKQGYTIVNASDNPVFLWRDMSGSQKPEHDKIKVWTRPGKSVPVKESTFMRQVRNRILGDRKKVTSKKASISPETGEFEGGVAFERSPAAISITPDNRCYPLSTAYQTTRNMHAPQKGRKTTGVGGVAAMAGLDGKGPEGLKKLLEDRAEYLNIPRVGDNDNVGFPTQQLNIAGAVEANEGDSLGKYGGNHADSGDSASAVTGMTCLSETREDVEEDIFFIDDFGIGLVLSEFDTVYFCGLHFHGGTQPRYVPGRRTSKECHVRLTLICYGPSSFFDIPASEAFITLLGKEGVFKVCNEMKDWSMYMHFERVASSQATYTSDGEALMESNSNFDHFVRDIVQFVAYAVDQYPRHEGARFNRRVLLSAFSSVRGGKRVGVDDWELGPGWSGDDTQVGKEYKEDLKTLSLNDLTMLHHSDTKTTYPYGNKKANDHAEAWKKHHEAMTSTIPLCVVSDFQDDNSLKPDANRRRTTTRNVRSGKTSAKPNAKSAKRSKASAKDIQPGSVTVRKRKRGVEPSAEDVLPPQKRKKTARNKPTDGQNSREDAEALIIRSANQTQESDQTCSYELALSRAFDQAHLLPMVASLISHIGMAIRARDLAESGSIASQMRVLLDRNDIHTVWQLKSKMEARRSSLEVETAINHAQLLMLCGATWAWLDHSIKSTYASLSTGDAHWMKALAIKVDSLIVSGNAADLDPLAFFPSLADHARTYRFKAIAMAKRVSNIVNFDFGVRPILMSWFGFPTSQVEVARGFLVRGVVEQFGVGALYLPAVWDLHERLARVIDPTHRKPTKRAVGKWKDRTVVSLQALGSDTGRSQLRDLAGAMASLSSGAISEVAWNRVAGEGSVTGAQLQRTVGGGGLDTIEHTYRITRLPSRNHLGCFDDMLNMFVDQIETLYPLLDAPGSAPQKPPRGSSSKEKATYKFLDLVFRNTDKKLPFRDMAASRRRVLEDGGPFSQQNLRTRKGFFSVMVHRGITHHSPFLVGQGETMFDNLADFKAAVASYGRREKTFFCDPSAYGMWTRLSVSAADTYWKSSGKKEHTHWMSRRGDDLIEFADLIPYRIGYAIAGLAKTPTVEEMGGIIYDIGKGGLAGLMTLGFKCDSREDTITAFKSLYEWMCVRLDPHRREQMGFNVFVLEHMLCKFKRLTVKAYRDIEGACNVA